LAKGLVTKQIQQFQKLSLKVKNIFEDNLLDLFMGILNDNIQHEVHLFKHKSLEKAFSMVRKLENKNTASRRVATKKYRKHHVPSPNPTQSTRLTPQQLDERRENRLCLNCDNKNSKGHKCSQKKLFYIDSEEEEDQELEPSQDLYLEEATAMISCHALANINTPQTLKIQ
jgi:hypothetical protein